MKNDIRVLYEDNHLLAVEKPPGVLSQGDSTGDETLIDKAKFYLKDKYHKPGAVYLGLVHRLDRPTGGVMLFARTSKAAGRLSEQFRARTVKKTYLAVCRGRLKTSEGELNNHLVWDESRRKTLVSTTGAKGSKLAQLSYEVLCEVSDLSLLQVRPKTGRKHQIRVQFSAIGHPLLGDTKYAEKRSRGRLVKSIGLWASCLEVLHPVKKEALHFRSFPDPEVWPIWSEFSSFLSSFPGGQG